MTATVTARRTAAGQALLERFAEVDSSIALIEAIRHEAVARANRDADEAAAVLLGERAAIVGKLETWWSKAAAALTQGARKSVELGGCMIGSRAGRESLTVTGDEKAIVEALGKLQWAQPLLNVKVSLDRRMALKSLGGEYAKQLTKLGLGKAEGTETFFVERVKQAGTLDSSGAKVGP